ncbi:MAG TPA: glycosyltransferase [Gammaproteobacteria bacterium]|nr:glycosyltransferase [Gammaproteobacteria bacterium]
MSQAIKRYNEDLGIKILAVHPRDASEQTTVDNFRNSLIEYAPDLVHFQYWNTAQQLIKNIPELKQYKKILTHHNQKNTVSENWAELGIAHHCVHTTTNRDILLSRGYDNRKISIIQHGIDLNLFEYGERLPAEGDETFGYVGRVVAWKGMREVARASREIGFQTIFMGHIDDVNYWESIPVEDKNVVIPTYIKCLDSERVEAYREMSVYVGNSNDGREEGPLGLLEAMACGVPVVTTPSGEAKDICVDGENSLVVPFGDYDALKCAMRRLILDRELAERLRSNAWETVRKMTEKRMAFEYRKLYFDLLFDDKIENPLVSVVIPFTDERASEMIKVLKSYEEQTYKNIEIIPVEDAEKGYGLAKARNIGAIKSLGEIIIFNDSRIMPASDAIEKFVEKLRTRQNTWMFGNKGANKKSFVENFSAVRRSEFMRFGMFCERINEYGGMSQEVRTRWELQGNCTEYVEDVMATVLCKSHKTREKRRGIINMKLLLTKMYGK